MAKISLICEQCGGNIVLDNSHEIGTCESCFAQFVVKQDQIVQKITQHITKHVYGYQGKDVEELLAEGYSLLDMGNLSQANAKFKRAVDIEPKCWSAWLGYADSLPENYNYLISKVNAYRSAFDLASNEEEQTETFVHMIGYLPDNKLRSAFMRAFNIATNRNRYQIFDMVSRVIGCDESEIASLAIDICPDDWRAFFAMAKFRQIRVRWCELEGGWFSGKHLPAHAVEVLNVFMQTYRLAKKEGEDAKTEFIKYVNELSRDNSFTVFATELQKAIQKEG